MLSRKIHNLTIVAAVVAAGCGVETKRDSKVKISSISPGTASITGGVEVSLSGEGFDDGSGAPTVTFGPGEADVLEYTDNALRVILPAGLGCGSVDVQVNNANGYAYEDHGFAYTGGSGVLGVTAISPAEGEIAGGTDVTITGSGFTGGAGITLGGVLLEDILVVSDTEIRARTPAQLDGGVLDLTIRNCADEATLSSAFLYKSGLNGLLVELPLFDYIRPGQFGGSTADFVDPFVAFVNPTAESLLNPLPSVLDSCKFNQADAPAVNFDILQAGEQVSFASGAQTMQVPLQSDSLYYYAANDPAASQTTKFVSNGSYAISSAGNASLPSFSLPGAFRVPADFTISAPSFASDTPATIARNAQLQWSWNASTPGDFFEIVLVGYDDNGNPTNEVLECFVRDDGSFLIPANEMGKIDNASQVMTYAIRRTDSTFTVPANGSTGTAVGQVYKIGLLWF